MDPLLASQAAASATLGNRMLTDYQNKAADYTGQYNTDVGAANTANQAVKDQTTYMQGAGSAGNQYTGNLATQLGTLGYSQDQMTGARNNLNQATGALSAYSDYANSAASKWGMNAGGFAAVNAGALGGINNNIAAQQGVVNGLSDIYKTAQTGANQYAGLQVQSQHEVMAGLQNVYTNAANTRDSAGSMMNFYNDLAQKQGGLNAQQANMYAQAQASYTQAQTNIALASQAYATAKNQLAAAGYANAQTTGANQTNAANANYYASQAYKNSLGGSGSSSPLSVSSILQPSMSGSQLQGSNGMKLQGSSTNLQGGNVRLQ